MAKTKRRELVQLASVYDPDKHEIGGWYMSEKLDGGRCFWDGGITRGLPTETVPWAGITHPKKLTRKPKIKPIATGLWSRYGNPIIAPDWFLDALPPITLDGEIWCGRGGFQLSRSIVAGDTPDSRWDQVSYACYGSPSFFTFTEPGLVKNASMYADIPEETLAWALKAVCRKDRTHAWLPEEAIFRDEMSMLEEYLCASTVAYSHSQIQLPYDEEDARYVLKQKMAEVVANKGEGLIVRDPAASYMCKRSKSLLKVKPSLDDEATLTGFTAGRGKYEGMIGALILEYHGKRFELSGMTDDERELINAPPVEPGKDLPLSAKAACFKVGDVIEFTYRELTDAGIPREARYDRIKRGTL